MPLLVLAGYFGCGNLGDEAVLLGFVHGLEGSGYDVTVLSESPEETQRRFGLRAVARRNFGEVGKALEGCDALVFPGGSIFQDATSVKSVAYYASLVKMAKKAGKRVFLVGQGVGPLGSFFGRRMAASAFNQADFVAVRDPESLQTLKDLGVKTRMKITADTALLIPNADPGPDNASFTVGDMKTVGIAPRPLPGVKPTVAVKMFGDLARLMVQSGIMPVFLEMDAKSDGPMIVAIGQAQGGKVPEIRKLTSPIEAEGRIARMEALIAVRLHAGILAAKVGVPPFMVGYDPKVTSFAKLMGLPRIPSLDGLTASRLFDQFQAFYKERAHHSRVLESKMPELIALARENVSLVLESLGGARA
ncbi:MAG: polysaccharide pyruvyl transferase CsaB [Fimbriimonadaceae bacterium]|nr:polysaccharide pyruvyl transferase CsaB [Fimbriimonadaceae bacterium]